jgi:hypothetical protein
MTDRHRLHPWTWPVVLLGGILVASRFGLNYGIGNHNTYLLHALRRVDPSVLSTDWLAAHSQDTHPVFTRLATLLLTLDGSGWLVATANVACIMAGAVAVYLVIREIAEVRYALPVYLLVMAFVGVGSTYSVSGSFLYSVTFQASTVAAVGYLFAMLSFVRQRFVISGVLLAVAGAFHANYLVLAFPLFGIAHLLLGRRTLVSRMAAQLVPSLVPLALMLPLLLAHANSASAEQARYIYQYVMSPQHYVPLTYLTEFIVYYAWCGLGLLAGWWIMSESESSRALRALWVTTILLVSVASLLTTVVFVPLVSQLYFWRLAPFTVLISQMFAAAALVKHLTAEEPSEARTRVLLFLGSAVLIWLTFRYHYGEYRFLHHGVLMVLAVMFLVKPWIGRWAPALSRSLGLAVVGGVWLVAAAVPASQIKARSNLISGLPTHEQELYAWARTTPDTSLFLIPPDLHNFRLNARRAIVMDTKSTPTDPQELLEWYRRAEIVSGISNVANRRAISDGYTRLDSVALESIRSSFAIDYVVVRARQSFRAYSQMGLIFENAAFQVYRVTSPRGF